MPLDKNELCILLCLCVCLVLFFIWNVFAKDKNCEVVGKKDSNELIRINFVVFHRTHTHTIPKNCLLLFLCAKRISMKGNAFIIHKLRSELQVICEKADQRNDHKNIGHETVRP